MIPEDLSASERDRHAAVDKLPLSIWTDLNSFSKSGQSTPSRLRIVSSSTSVGEFPRLLNTAPILRECNHDLSPDKRMC